MDSKKARALWLTAGLCAGCVGAADDPRPPLASDRAGSAQTDYYLSPSGADSNDCVTTATACATVAHVETLAAAGDVIHFAGGVYRLTVSGSPTTGRIVAKDAQTFVGPACTPPNNTTCAVLDGSVLLGGFSGPDANGNYKVAGPDGVHAAHGCYPCAAGWGGCNYPEELFWDDTELQHAGQQLTGTISFVSVTSGTITGTGRCTAVANTTVGPIAMATIAIANGIPTGNLTITGYTDCDGAVPTSWTLSGGTGGATCAGKPTITTTGGTVKPPTLTGSSWWYDYTNGVIYVGQNPQGHKVETSVTTTVFAPASPQANGVTVQNLTIQKFAAQNQQGGGIDASYGRTSSAASGVGWVVQGNYVTFNHSAGIRAGFGMQILDNIATQNGQLGIGGGLPAVQGPSQLLVQNNKVTYNNISHMSPGFGAGGIKFGNTAGAVVRGNTVDHNYGNGIHFDVNSIAPVIDGNTITQNWDAISQAGSIGVGTGIIFEIGNGGATIRNNYVQFNGTGGTYGLQSSTSEGAEAYCNVIEEMTGVTNTLWMINAADRGDVAAAPYPDYCPSSTTPCHQLSQGNYFHHNTFIWDDGATGTAGFAQHDVAGQPSFFVSNTPPDYNEYHLSPALGSGAAKFSYDGTSSGSNTLVDFATFQANGADHHGRADTINGSGFPMVMIASPSDGASVTGATAVTVQASDASTIAKVDLYVDWVLVGTSNNAPYTFTWNGAASGNHTIVAVAYGQSSVSACNAITVSYAGGGTSGSPDAATSEPPTGKAGGCGCHSAGPTDGLIPLLVVLLAARRRRRVTCCAGNYCL